jgi:hypothetical protein
VQVTYGSRTHAEGTAVQLLAWRLGWLLSLGALNETCWQPSRLEIYPLRFQARLGLCVDKAAPRPRPILPKSSLGLTAVLLICGQTVQEQTARHRSGGVGDL